MLKKAQQIKDIVRISGGLWASSILLDRAGIPILRLWPDIAVSFATLAEQTSAIFRAWGMPESHVGIAVEHLLYADLHGIDSHGCGQILGYYLDLTAGRLTPTPQIQTVRETVTTALVDGGGGFGCVAGNYAMQLAIAKCRESGIGAVAVRNSNHYGAAGSYALMAARAGMLGVSMTSGPQPAMVPTFGIQAMLGTNPIAFAAPAGRNRPFLLDMATSTVPLGRLATAQRKGKSIPKGWALDAQGRPVRNPGRAERLRRLTPLGSTREMGSHKGYGLAAMVEILSSVLSSRCYADEQAREYRPVGHFFLALDPRPFRSEGAFADNMDALMDSLRATKPENPSCPVMVAGDPEWTASENRRHSGIPVSRSIVEDIRFVCTACGAPFILDKKH